MILCGLKLCVTGVRFVVYFNVMEINFKAENKYLLVLCGCNCTKEIIVTENCVYFRLYIDTIESFSSMSIYGCKTPRNHEHELNSCYVNYNLSTRCSLYSTCI